MIWLATSEELNKIVNDPSVRAALDQTFEHVDMEQFLSLPEYEAFTDGYRAAVCVEHEPGAYLCHIFCPAGSRGKGALSFGREVRDIMFRCGVKLLVCEIPVNAWVTKSYAKRLGFQPVSVCLSDDGIPYSTFHMRKENLI